MPSELPTPAVDSPPAKTLSRRRLFKRFFVYGALPIVVGTYAFQIEPFWPEFHEITIPVANLPKSFEGFRIAQLTDLHAGRTPFSYLQKVIARVEQLKPDLVAVTGDLVHHNRGWIPDTSKLLATLSAPVVVSFGNHDYGIYRDNDETADNELPDILQTTLEQNNCLVLRNKSHAIEHADGRLWLVGLDDIWFGQFNAPQAFKDVPADEPAIAMTHNPDTAERVDRHSPSLILSGHTHGGQVRLPFVGALYLNTTNRKLDQGYFKLRNSPLYVSRGVGYIHRVRFYCRPEIPIFRLTRA